MGVEFMIDTILIGYKMLLSEAQLHEIDWDDRHQKEYFKKDITYHSYGYYKGESKPRMRYYPKTGLLTVEVSVPTFIYGSNIYDYDTQDAPLFISMLRRYVSKALNIDESVLDDFEKAEVKRLDVYKHYRASDPINCYLEYFSKQRIPQYSCEAKYNGDAMFWIAVTRKIKIYIKLNHMKKLMKERKMYFTPEELKMMENILKLEVTLSADDLYNLHPEREFRDILTSPSIDRLLNRDAERIGLFKEVNINSRASLIGHIYSQPETVLTKSDKQKAIYMLEIYNMIGVGAIKDHFSTAVEVKLKQKLRIIGLKQMAYSNVELKKLNPVVNYKQPSLASMFRNINLITIDYMHEENRNSLVLDFIVAIPDNVISIVFGSSNKLLLAARSNDSFVYTNF